MLHDFLNANRKPLIEMCRVKFARHTSQRKTSEELDQGIPLFLDQLIEILKLEQSSNVETGAGRRADGVMSRSASRHGAELMSKGYTIDEVVHNYGDVCQAITELAGKSRASVTIEEFRTLNRCLDNAIASAVTEFWADQESARVETESQALDENARVTLHQLMSHVRMATLAVHAVKAGKVGLRGATGSILDMSLASMMALIERGLGAKAKSPSRAAPPEEPVRH